MASILYKGKGSSYSERMLFWDNCESSSIPSGVTYNPANILFDATKKARYTAVNTVTNYKINSLMPVKNQIRLLVGIELKTFSPGTLDTVYFRILTSGVLRYQCVFQGAGNIVIYRQNGSVPWSSNSVGQGFPLANGQLIISELLLTTSTLVWRNDINNYTGLQSLSSSVSHDFSIQQTDLVTYEIGWCTSMITNILVYRSFF